MSIIFSENNSLCAAPPPYTHCTYRQKGAVRQQGLGGASSPSAHEPCGTWKGGESATGGRRKKEGREIKAGRNKALEKKICCEGVTCSKTGSRGKCEWTQETHGSFTKE